MTGATYTCWSDGEDLTARVIAAIGDKGHVTIQDAEARDATDTNAVVVVCTKGHENVFQIAED